MAARLFPVLTFLTLLSSVVAADKDHATILIPAVLPAVVALALFGLSGIALWIQFFRIGRNAYMLPLTIGMTAMAGGFAVRILVHNSPTSLSINITTTLLILLSPCLFLALDYMILGRLAGMLGSEVASKAMFIAPTRVAKIFVWSDVATFVIQALGGSMLTSHDADKQNLGNKIILIGLALQLASFALFMSLVVVFGFRVKKHFPHVWHPKGTGSFRALGAEHVDDWHILYYTLAFTCVAILIRSIFRMAEFIQGHTGYISTHEVFFYCFDSLPLWTGMTLYFVVWPPRFLGNIPKGVESMELTSGRSRGYEHEG
ncbi:RTA1 like protein-domain-containing protein [Mycena olivaceomarginata]|nr:RTA1 like protein-domain-containing protein [Mycena olivaceomarginata]